MGLFDLFKSKNEIVTDKNVSKEVNVNKALFINEEEKVYNLMKDEMVEYSSLEEFLASINDDKLRWIMAYKKALSFHRWPKVVRDIHSELFEDDVLKIKEATKYAYLMFEKVEHMNNIYDGGIRINSFCELTSVEQDEKMYDITMNFMNETLKQLKEISKKNSDDSSKDE